MAADFPCHWICWLDLDHLRRYWDSACLIHIDTDPKYEQVACKWDWIYWSKIFFLVSSQQLQVSASQLAFPTCCCTWDMDTVCLSDMLHSRTSEANTLKVQLRRSSLELRSRRLPWALLSLLFHQLRAQLTFPKPELAQFLWAPLWLTMWWALCCLGKRLLLFAVGIGAHTTLIVSLEIWESFLDLTLAMSILAGSLVDQS